MTAESSTVSGAPKFRTRVDIPDERREALAALLNERLADSTDLYTQTKQAHWNVKGRDFFQLHELFDQLAAIVLPHVDMIAERVTALGGTARGTARMAAEGSSLPELPDGIARGGDYVTALADRYGEHANRIREAIDRADELQDQGTTDLFTEVVRDIDKALYFLEAHLRGE